MSFGVVGPYVTAGAVGTPPSGTVTFHLPVSFGDPLAAFIAQWFATGAVAEILAFDVIPGVTVRADMVMF